MGIKSTYEITRSTALQVLAWYKEDGTDLNDDDLAFKLEDFEESHFRNYCIVDNIKEGERAIHNLHQFLNAAV